MSDTQQSTVTATNMLVTCGSMLCLDRGKPESQRNNSEIIDPSAHDVWRCPACKALHVRHAAANGSYAFAIKAL